VRIVAVLLVVLLLPLAAGQRGDQEFETLDGAAEFDVHTDGSPLNVTVWVHTGAARGLTVDGPGECADRSFTQSITFTPGSGGAWQTFRCGPVAAGVHPLRLSGGAVTEGSLALDGGSWTARPADAQDSDVPGASVPAPGAAWGWALALPVLLFHRWLLLGLFSRIPDARVDGHPNRQRILRLLQERPGLHEAALAEAAGLSRGAVHHHLLILEAKRRIHSTRHGRRRLWSLANQDPKDAVDPRFLDGLPLRILE